MTRIIAGRFRGRRLEVPRGKDVRPTTDRMRERLFSMLAHSRYPALEGARVADLFAGTGALGLEALSRGAEQVTFVEKVRPSLACLHANIETLGVEEQASVMPIDARRLGSAQTPYDIIFMDPPYREGLVPQTLDRLRDQGWLRPGTLIICEVASDEELALAADVKILDDRKQGQQRILFLLPEIGDAD